MAPQIVTIVALEEDIHEHVKQLQDDLAMASVKEINHIMGEGQLTEEKQKKIKNVQKAMREKADHYDTLLSPEDRATNAKNYAVAEQLSVEERLTFAAAMKEVGEHVADGLDLSSIEKLRASIVDVRATLSAVQELKAKDQAEKGDSDGGEH